MSAPAVTLATARLARTADGTPCSADFGDIYHSSHGAIEQARHVFLGGNGLPARWGGRASFAILETGFGLGLNFLATWDAWRCDPARSRRLHFVSVESAPLCCADLAAALAPFAPFEDLARALLAVWPAPFAGFHRMHFDGGRVVLTVLLGEARALLPQLVATIDAFYLDGFSPAKNPGAWSPEVVRELARVAAPDATLATWTVAGGVRSALADAGFRVGKRAGFAAKREMLVGEREGSAAPEAPPAARHAMVVGAGLAGSLVADRLAMRDWDVELLDARSVRSAAAVGLVRPIANLRDALNARISRSAFLYALQHYRALQQGGYSLVWNRCGALQLASGDDEAARMEVIARSHGYPAQFLEFVDASRAGEIAGRTVRGPGWWFPSGAVVAPESVGVASLARAGERVRRVAANAVARIERDAGQWSAFDAAGAVIARAPVVVLANAADAARLLPAARLRLSAVRGQVTYLPPAPRRALDVIVSGTGYVAPLPEGGHCIGATYGHDDFAAEVRIEDQRQNLEHAAAMLPGFTDGVDAGALGGWTGFRATVPDRLPIFGAAEIEQLFTATGLGSRGLLWGPLGAELLACAVAGEPLPLARDFAGAISPRRFLS